MVLEVLNAGKGLGRSPSRLLEDSSVEAAMPAVTAPAAVLAAARAPLTAINVCTCTVAPAVTPPSPQHRVSLGQSPSHLVRRFRQRQGSSSRSSHEHAVLADRAMEEVAITLTLPLCRRVAVAMGGDIGISDIRVAPSRTITRFWCVVAATSSPSSARHLSGRGLRKVVSLGGVAAEVPLTARRDVLANPGPAAVNVAGASGRGGVGGSDSVSTAAAGPALGSVELPCTEDVRPGSDSSASFSCMVDMGGSVGAGDSSSVTIRRKCSYSDPSVFACFCPFSRRQSRKQLRPIPAPVAGSSDQLARPPAADVCVVSKSLAGLA